MKKNMKSKKLTIAGLILLFCLVLGGCKKETVEGKEDEVDQEPIEEIEVDLHEGEAISPLTGLWIDEDIAKRRPVGVMINNSVDAIPQSGISQAEVIYETLAEGGVTRLFAVFQDFDGEKIGPVRSCRHYYLDYALDHDAIYVHYGQSSLGEQALVDLDIDNLNGLSSLDNVMFFRSTDRVAPHNAYTFYEGIMEGWEQEGYRTDIDTSIPNKFKFSEEEVNLQGEISANEVILPFSYKTYESSFTYDSVVGEYKRYHMGGEEHIDVENGEQLSFKNIIVQYVDMWEVEGYSSGVIDQRLISDGNGYYITNGKAEEITWEKTDHHLPTKYYDSQGNELEINTGKTWIAVFPSDKEVIFE